MGKFFYELVVAGYRILAGILALFDPKARKLVSGKANWKAILMERLPVTIPGQTMWFHCASVGEFEQCRPVIEELKTSNPDIFIVLTFFSPSGYELLKDYELADAVTYLPWDSQHNARSFLDIVNPKLIGFVRYEFWYHFLNEAANREIPVFLISGIFRREQLFFKFYGGFYLSMLKYFEHFFVQNRKSEELMTELGFRNVTISGDTRIDRVKSISQQRTIMEPIERFIGNSTVLIAGSTWPADESLLIPVIKKLVGSVKTIIAPHEIDDGHIKRLLKHVGAGSALYSDLTDGFSGEARVLIIDNVGMLASLYRYGHYAYVGGAFGDGLHSILEPAAYGLPVFFGNRNYSDFQEALDLIALNCAFLVGESAELESKLSELMTDSDLYNSVTLSINSYVEEKAGATKVIVKGLTQTLQEK